MNIANIDISRAIAHEVVRASQLEDRPPVLSDILVALDNKGKQLVGKRLVATLASGSHCVDVTFDDSTAGSPFDHSSSMLDADDVSFVSRSKHLAGCLSSAQTAGPIKSGSVLFVQGSCIADDQQSRFIAIIKADSDQALYKTVDGDNITLTYVNDMVLGESQRLIKIAFLIEDFNAAAGFVQSPRNPDDFSIKVFDHLMQTSGDSDAAIYFYRTFLKCRLADNASRQTKIFYDTAHNFINTLPMPQADRVAYQGDLISYFRQNSATLEPRSFAQAVLPTEHQDAFVVTCREAGITQAFSKDLGLMKGKLRKQSVKFTSNVTLYAPSEVFKNSVKIIGASDDGWTDLKIRGSIEAMP